MGWAGGSLSVQLLQLQRGDDRSSGGRTVKLLPVLGRGGATPGLSSDDCSADICLSVKRLNTSARWQPNSLSLSCGNVSDGCDGCDGAGLEETEWLVKSR